MKLKENARTIVLEALGKRMAEVLTALDEHKDVDVVELMQKGLLTYEDLVEPSKVSLEDEFWTCCYPEEIENRRHDLEETLEYLQADKMAAAMESVAANLATCKISQTTGKLIFDLIEDYMNNREVYE